MSKLTDVDAALLRWANRFNERNSARVTARSITGLPVKRGNRNKSRTPGDVRRHLKGIVERRPQVMVKISGGGRGMRAIRAHLNYISRNGQLPVETQEEERVVGQLDLESMADEWQLGGFPIDEVSTRREAFNIVLSMPAGTDAIALHRAARAFAKDEFSGHQYALVLHTFENDPNREPSENPHVHLCVKALGADGVRLNPRKHDLRRWREQFAERLREHGVDAEASSRAERFQPVAGSGQAEYHKKNRMGGIVPVSDFEQASIKKKNLGASKHVMLKDYGELARALAVSANATDRELAIQITAVASRQERHTHDKEMGWDFDR